MGAVTKQATLAAPPEKVWEAITDPETYAKWNSSHVAFPDGPPDLTAGATYREQMTVMGMPSEVNWTVSEVEDGKRVVLEGIGAMGVKVRNGYALEPDGDGTAVTFESEFSGDAIAAMEAPLEAAASSAGDEAMKKLQGLVEG